MAENKKAFKRPVIDEEELLNVIGGEDSAFIPEESRASVPPQHRNVKVKTRSSAQKNMDYEERFLQNRYPGGRNGKVVYIRPQFHERLMRMVQLDVEGNMTLYAYLDNILEHHFSEFSSEITAYFNEKYKPII